MNMLAMNRVSGVSAMSLGSTFNCMRNKFSLRSPSDAATVAWYSSIRAAYLRWPAVFGVGAGFGRFLGGFFGLLALEIAAALVEVVDVVEVAAVHVEVAVVDVAVVDPNGWPAIEVGLSKKSTLALFTALIEARNVR